MQKSKRQKAEGRKLKVEGESKRLKAEDRKLKAESER
jgi:hypothetical protein